MSKHLFRRDRLKMWACDMVGIGSSQPGGIKITLYNLKLNLFFLCIDEMLRQSHNFEFGVQNLKKQTHDLIEGSLLSIIYI